jgi:hypothetical protein
MTAQSVAKRVFAIVLSVVTAVQIPAAIALAEQSESPTSEPTVQTTQPDAPEQPAEQPAEQPNETTDQPTYVDYVPLQNGQPDGAEVVEEPAAMEGYKVEVVEPEPEPNEQVVEVQEENGTGVEIEVQSQTDQTPARDCDFVASCERELSKWPAGQKQSQWACKYWVGPYPDKYTDREPIDAAKGGHWGYSTWCSEFVGWNLWNVGLVPGQTMPYIPDRSSAFYDFYSAHSNLAEIHENNGSYTPRRGDIVLTSGLGHTEMVSEVEAGGMSWTGVSGGDMLTRVRHEITDKTYRYFITIKWKNINVPHKVDTSVPLTHVVAKAISDQKWTGKAVTPKPTVTYGYYNLREGTDYTLSYKDNVNSGTARVIITGKGAYYGTKTLSFAIRKSQTTKTPVVSYRTHVQKIGWQGFVKDGAVSGTSGQSKRLEGIRIKLGNLPVSGSIQYRTHIQRKGWEKGWKSDGNMSGTSGKSLRLEAIQIRLTGEMAKKYDVYYRVHAQKFGWMGWAKNGENAGTAGYSYRLEAIQIVLVPKGQSKPTATLGGVRQKVSTPFKKR